MQKHDPYSFLQRRLLELGRHSYDITVNHRINVHSHLMLLVRDTCWLQFEAVSVELVNNGRRLHCGEKLFMPPKNHEVSHSLGRPFKSQCPKYYSCKSQIRGWQLCRPWNSLWRLVAASFIDKRPHRDHESPQATSGHIGDQSRSLRARLGCEGKPTSTDIPRKVFVFWIIHLQLRRSGR